MDPHPDQKYIDALVSNDSIVILEIYQNFRDMVINMVKKNRGTAEDGEDHFQDVLVILRNQSIRNQTVLSCPFKSYLYLIAKRRWQTKLNKKGTKGVTIVDPDGLSNIGDDAQALAEELLREDQCLDLVLKHLNNLGERCRDFINSKIFKRMKSKEIAELFETTPNYINKKTSDCYKKLRQRIKADPLFVASCLR